MFFVTNSFYKLVPSLVVLLHHVAHGLGTTHSSTASATCIHHTACTCCAYVCFSQLLTNVAIGRKISALLTQTYSAAWPTVDTLLLEIQVTSAAAAHLPASFLCRLLCSLLCCALGINLGLVAAERCTQHTAHVISIKKALSCKLQCAALFIPASVLCCPASRQHGTKHSTPACSTNTTVQLASVKNNATRTFNRLFQLLVPLPLSSPEGQQCVIRSFCGSVHVQQLLAPRSLLGGQLSGLLCCLAAHQLALSLVGSPAAQSCTESKQPNAADTSWCVCTQAYLEAAAGRTSSPSSHVGSPAKHKALV